MLNSIPRSRAATIAGVLKKAPSCYHPSAQPIATELLKMILELPQLLLIEITFLPYGVRSELRSLLADGHSPRPLHVFDLCESKSITAALGLSSCSSLSESIGIHETGSNDCSLASHLALLLDAAANCSNAVRQTPLHVAVDVDDANAVEVRLQHTGVLMLNNLPDRVIYWLLAPLYCISANHYPCKPAIAKEATEQLSTHWTSTLIMCCTITAVTV